MSTRQNFRIRVIKVFMVTIMTVSVFWGNSLAGGGGRIFKDDFESGNLTHQENGMRWGREWNVSVSTENPKTGNYSLRFFFQGGPAEQDAFSELRFHFDGNQYSELWIKYDLFIPANFYHRDAPGADNNKFIALWSGEYTHALTGPAFIPNTWARPLGESEVLLFAAGSQKPEGGFLFRKVYWYEGGKMFEVADRGKWLTIVIHAKYATVANNDGVFRIWKIRDGVTIPVLNKTDGAWYVPGQPGFDQGYLLGWTNSGFDEDTIIYIDNIEFSTTSLLEGVDVAGITAPASGLITTEDGLVLWCSNMP